jgi:signal transduction histidine kinase
MREADTATREAIDLVTHVAHDLRSPLTSILFLTDALRSGESGPLSPAQTEQLTLIYSAAFRLSSLVEDLTQYSQRGEDFLESVPVPFQVADVFNSVRDIVRPIALEKKLDLRFSSAISDRRLGHPAALGRIMLNLVTNALKFTEEGSVEIRAVNRSGSCVEFSVSDSGPGLSSDALTAAREEIRSTLRARGQRFSTSGLGLVICRRLIRAMRGDLRIVSTPSGTSASFAIDLPIATDVN